jgi:hypothetical protein
MEKQYGEEIRGREGWEREEEVGCVVVIKGGYV